jgi:glycine cleavage system H protein
VFLTLLLVFCVLLLAGVLVNSVLRASKRAEAVGRMPTERFETGGTNFNRSFDMAVLEGLHYTNQHEWVKIDGEVATVGISDFAQQLLGEITYVELPEVDMSVSGGGELAVVESSKAASDVYTPVAGEIMEVNDQLETTPELINDDCYGDGWICRIRLAGEVKTEDLMDSVAYEAFLKTVEE